MLDIKGEFATHVSNTVASDIVKGSHAPQATMFILCEGGHDCHRCRTAAIVLVADRSSGSAGSPNFCWQNQEDHPRSATAAQEIGQAQTRRVARQP